MYVFHDRRLEALERTSNAVAIAIERLVECTAFSSEPEWMANSLSPITLGRWFTECPDTSGVRTARKFLRAELLDLSQSSPDPHSTFLHLALQASKPLDTVLDEMRLAFQQSSGTALLTSIAASDCSATVLHAERLASCWLASQLHPQTIFKKLVGFALNPEQKHTESTVSERLAEIIDDFATRVPQPHAVSAVVDLGLSKRRRSPPSILDVEVTSKDPENNKLVLRATVRAPDPIAAAARARSKFLELVHAWRSGAHDLQALLPTALQVQMPNGETVSIETRTFRVARPRSDMTPSWANLNTLEDMRFLSAAEAMTRAREEVSQGRTAQAISTLWSAAEGVLRRDSEHVVAPMDLETRLSTPFIVYFTKRQFALLGVYLDSSKATKPRVRSPVEPKVVLRDLVADQLQPRIQGQRAFLRHRISELLGSVSDCAMLQTQLVEIRRKIHLVLSGARTIRNVYVHSRVRIALDFEELYVYKWLETMLDVFLNDALARSRTAGFDFNRYLDSLASRMVSFNRRVAAGPPLNWVVSV